MQARIWGCRGSLASPGPGTVRYGGNTSCVEVRLTDGTLLILDAGTGIRPLAMHLGTQPPKIIHLLLTHMHLDHIEGLGFFGPMRNPGVEMHVWGPSSTMLSLEEIVERVLSPPLFPVQLHDIASGLIFHDNPDGEWKLGGARITAESVTHQGPTVGYRIQENGRALVYIPDHEPARGADLFARTTEWLSGFSVTWGADVLLHDAQYTEEEYNERVGWGHSSVVHTVQFAKLTDVRRLVMFHHDPYHDDDLLEELLVGARRQWGKESDRVILAAEGMTLDL